MTRRTVVFDVVGFIVRWQQPEVRMRQCFPQQAIDSASAESVKSLVFGRQRRAAVLARRFQITSSRWPTAWR